MGEPNKKAHIGEKQKAPKEEQMLGNKFKK